MLCSGGRCNPMHMGCLVWHSPKKLNDNQRVIATALRHQRALIEIQWIL